MQITIIDDNGQKHEVNLSRRNKGIGPEEAITESLKLFSGIYTPIHILYVLRKRILPELEQILF